MRRKNIQKYILLLLFIVAAQIADAQSFTLQGKVSDKDGNPIELASVMVVSQGKLSMTNLKGEFNMQLQSEDSVKVRFSMIGYRTKTRILVRPKGKQTLLVQLADDNELQEVVVQGKTKQHGGVRRSEDEARTLYFGQRCRRVSTDTGGCFDPL